MIIEHLIAETIKGSKRKALILQVDTENNDLLYKLVWTNPKNSRYLINNDYKNYDTASMCYNGLENY